MPKPRKKRYPFQVDCVYCGGAEIVYATDEDDADIKIVGRGWKKNPYRCLRCVAAADQKRTGVLEPGT